MTISNKKHLRSQNLPSPRGKGGKKARNEKPEQELDQSKEKQNHSGKLSTANSVASGKSTKATGKQTSIQPQATRMTTRCWGFLRNRLNQTQKARQTRKNLSHRKSFLTNYP